jgi:iron complex outermembrane recepter protein
MHTYQKILRRILLAAGLAILAGPVLAQSQATASIEGRVQDLSRGDYLNNARIRIEGTSVSVLTNEFGEYRITGLPAGEVTLNVFYSGLPPERVTVHLSPGQRAVQNIDLKGAGAGLDRIQLEAFTVSASREMSQAAIATNEQRFAPNIKTVLSADEFGEQSENNVAEFLKLMPSVEISYVEQDARNVSVRGMPAHSTIVTSNGNQLASAASGTATRVFEFEQISINEVARVEVNKSLMPDMPAEGIGGTINLITKSAFERSRPELRYRTYLNVNTRAMEWGKTPGPFREERHKMRPGFDFSYINPVSKNFGFAVSGASSHKFNPQYFADRTWNISATPQNPFLSQILYLDAPKITLRASGRVSFDWRVARNHIVSIGYSQQYYRAEIGNRRWDVRLGSNPTAYTPEYVQGRANAGQVGFTNSMNDKSGTTWTPEFKYLFNGSNWKIESGGAYSKAGSDYRAAEKGFFSGVGTISAASINPSGSGLVAPTVRFNYNHNDYLPQVSAVLANGQQVDPFDASQMFLNSANALRRKAVDLKKSIRLNAQRHVSVYGQSFRVKTGGDYRQTVRDMRDVTPSYTFLGPDGRANTEDNRLAYYDLVDDRYSTVKQPFGLPKFTWYSPWKIHDLFRAHPEWFTTNEATTHTNLVANSRYIDERISAGYVRLDTSFLRNRLAVSGGWRYQNYQVRSESGEVDSLSRYLKDEDGNVMFDPITGQPIVLPGNALEVTQRTNVERGIVRTRVVNDFYPSVNVMFRITDDLQLRSSFANSINYPNLDQIAATTTVSDLTANPRRITVNRPLEPWFAKNYDVELQYFTPAGGSMAVSFFRKEVVNFINTATYHAGTPESHAALERNNYATLIPLNFEVVEKFNDPRQGRFLGWEFALNQNLDPFVPEWGRGLSVFFNHTYRATPRGNTTISAQSVRVLNWGGSYKRGKLSTTLKWNHVPEPKLRTPSTTHNRSRTYMDADLTYRVMRNLSIFASGTNVMGVPVENYVYNEFTPDYARRMRHRYFGVQLVAGIRGSF